MKSTFTLLFALAVSIGVFAQGELSVMVGDAASQNFTAQDIALCNDGGYIMGGASGTVSYSTSGDPMIVKTDANGNTLWSRSLHLTGIATTNGVAAVGQAVSGNYYVLVDGGGGYWSTYAPHHFALAEFDVNGNLVWEKSYELNTGGNYWGGKHQVYQLPTGEYYISPNLWNSAYIIKTNGTGDMLWAKMIDGDSPTDKTPSFDINVSSDGSVTCCCKDENDRLVCRLDASGNVLWSRKYMSGLYVHTKSVIETSDGNLVMMGLQGVPFVMKINSADGSIMWYNEYNMGSVYANYLWDGYETATGELMIVADGTYISVMKLDANGNVLDAYNTDATMGTGFSHPTIEPLAGGQFVMIALDEYTLNGSLLLTGTESGEFNCGMVQNTNVIMTPYNWSTTTFQDGYVTSTDVGVVVSDPIIVNALNVASREVCGSTVGIEESNEKASVELYPNPASGSVNIEVSVTTGMIEVVNLTGQTIEQITIQNEIINVSLEEYSSGIYFVKVISDNKLIDTQKLIVE